MQHAAKEEDTAQAVQKSSVDVAHNRLTLLQFGLLRNATAEALHTTSFATSPGEAMHLLARLRAARTTSLLPARLQHRQPHHIR